MIKGHELVMYFILAYVIAWAVQIPLALKAKGGSIPIWLRASAGGSHYDLPMVWAVLSRLICLTKKSK